MAFNAGKREETGSRRSNRGTGRRHNQVCCFIARVEDGGVLRITGIGHQVSRGLRAGTIVDMDAAEQAIGTTVHTAEQMAGRRSARCWSISPAASRPRRPPTWKSRSAATRSTTPMCAERWRRRASSGQRRPGTDPLDGGRLCHRRQPRHPRPARHVRRQAGRPASPSPPAQALRNLATCVARCHLDIESFVVSPYAAARRPWWRTRWSLAAP